MGVWCAVNGYNITGPIFFNNTINGQIYRHDMLKPFFKGLADIDCQNGYFQQDFATAHTANETFELIREFLKIWLLV